MQKIILILFLLLISTASLKAEEVEIKAIVGNPNLKPEITILDPAYLNQDNYEFLEVKSAFKISYQIEDKDNDNLFLSFTADKGVLSQNFQEISLDDNNIFKGSVIYLSPLSLEEGENSLEDIITIAISDLSNVSYKNINVYLYQNQVN
jgi:hypothetical protein